MKSCFYYVWVVFTWIRDISISATTRQIHASTTSLGIFTWSTNLPHHFQRHAKLCDLYSMGSDIYMNYKLLLSSLPPTVGNNVFLSHRFAVFLFAINHSQTTSQTTTNPSSLQLTSNWIVVILKLLFTHILRIPLEIQTLAWKSVLSRLRKLVKIWCFADMAFSFPTKTLMMILVYRWY